MTPMKRNRNVDIDYLAGQLKNNTELKSMVIKLAIHRRLNPGKYLMFSAVEGVYNALIDILNILQSKYINNSNTKTHEQMDQDAEKKLRAVYQT